MIEYKIIKEPKQVVDKVFCNCCGNEITDNEFVHIDHQWGYNSHKDYEQHQFDICESCYDSFINNFKIKPKIEDRW